MRPKMGDALEQAVASVSGVVRFVSKMHCGRSRRFICEFGGTALRGLGG